VKSIGLDAPVEPVGWHRIGEGATSYVEWEVADQAVGWHDSSGVPGQGENIVLSAHNNVKGELFRHLVDLDSGDIVSLYVNDASYTYTVTTRLIFPYKGLSKEEQLKNGWWIGPFSEERLTLVSCWPYHSNTHRVIVVAKPERS
jgi:sortase A